MTNNQWQIPNC